MIRTGEWRLDIAVLVVAVALDAVVGEVPAAVHPVVWMGKLISRLERHCPKLDRPVLSLAAGTGLALCVSTLSGGVAWLAAAGLREAGAVAYVVGGAVLLSTTFAVKELGRAALITGRAVEDGDRTGAREGLRSLVSRDTADLAPPLMLMAAIESAAENTTDSFVGPWLAFALFGLPGAFAYRAVNTLDSMIGYRGEYEYLGKASARLDDLVNLIPARLSAVLMLVAAGPASGRFLGGGWAVARRDRKLTASPNAGWTIGAMSGLLGVALEKVGHYRLGDGLRNPTTRDLRTAVRVCYSLAVVMVPVAGAVIAARSWVVG